MVLYLSVDVDQPQHSLCRRNNVSIVDGCCYSFVKNPSRLRKAYQCSTSERVGRETYKEALLRNCDERGDLWADQVRLIMDDRRASSDLHAADARYHEDCRKRFCGRLVQKNERADDDEVVNSDDNSDEFRLNVPSGSMPFLAIILI